MKRLSFNLLHLLNNIVNLVTDEDRSLVYRQLLAAGILSEAAVVGNEVCHVLGARLGGKQDGTVHQGDVLRHVGQVFDAVVHGERDVDDIALLPLAVDGDVAGRSADDVYGLAVYLYGELSGLYPAWIAHQQRELTLALCDGDTTRFGIGELCFLTDYDALFFPVQL